MATLVVTIDRCQKNRSPAKARPAKTSARPIRPSDGSRASAILSQAHSSGSASVTRQKALANGPTSARRTKIGDMPIASAPATRAAKGAPKPPCGLAAGEACVIGFRFPRPERAKALASRRSVLILAAGDRQGGGMDARAWREARRDRRRFRAVRANSRRARRRRPRHLRPRRQRAAAALRRPRPAARGARAPHRLRHRRRLAGAPARRKARRAGGAFDLLAAADRRQSRRRRPDAGDAGLRRRPRARQRADRRGGDRAPPPPLLGALSRGDRGDGRGDAGDAARRRRSSRSIRSRRIGAARRGRGRSACCGMPIRACPRR